jgi:hypothetical protein
MTHTISYVARGIQSYRPWMLIPLSKRNKWALMFFYRHTRLHIGLLHLYFNWLIFCNITKNSNLLYRYFLTNFFLYIHLTDVSGQHNGRLCTTQSNIQIQRTTKGRFYLQVWVFYCCCSMEQIQDSQSSLQDQDYSTHKGHRSNSGFWNFSFVPV